MPRLQGLVPEPRNKLPTRLPSATGAAHAAIPRGLKPLACTSRARAARQSGAHLPAGAAPRARRKRLKAKQSRLGLGASAACQTAHLCGILQSRGKQADDERRKARWQAVGLGEARAGRKGGREAARTSAIAQAALAGAPEPGGPPPAQFPTECADSAAWGRQTGLLSPPHRPADGCEAPLDGKRRKSSATMVRDVSEQSNAHRAAASRNPHQRVALRRCGSPSLCWRAVPPPWLTGRGRSSVRGAAPDWALRLAPSARTRWRPRELWAATMCASRAY